MQNNSLSYIHPEAKIGDNVTVEPFSAIYENVEIGDGTWIGPNVTIMPGARIGKNCKIHPGAVISNIPQDLKFHGEETVAIVGDNTVIRECVTVNRGTVEKYKTEVGSNCLLMAYVHVAHDCIIKDYAILANSVQLGGHVEVGYHAVMGGTSVVHQFCKIGDHAMVQGGALLRKDVPPFVKAGREPVIYDGVNTTGLKRRNFSLEDIYLIQDIYRLIFQSGYNNTQGIEQLQVQFPSGEIRDKILNFMKISVESGRGTIRAAR
jgi:UDP-N-acetylglucosamine acyltransferase